MESSVKKIAQQFGNDASNIEALTGGLIHKTYKITSTTGNPIILQQVNTAVFRAPQEIIGNYQLIYQHLHNAGGIKIPALIKTLEGQGLYADENVYWRAFEFVRNSYTETIPITPEKIFSAAKCYGEFVRALFDLDVNKLAATIPAFHDLSYRYNQLQQAIALGNTERLKKSEMLLKKIDERKSLVKFYEQMLQNPEFKIRAMHHDCKLSNILFDMRSKQAICPIDLDTTMPGYFFSDIGDMIRSMVSETDEKSSAENLIIQKEYYEAILTGYTSGIGDAFTQQENAALHHAGPVMIYMQATRFLTDYLSNDVYYKIEHPHQNFDKAKNQIMLLEKFEEFLEEAYQYKIR